MAKPDRKRWALVRYDLFPYVLCHRIDHWKGGMASICPGLVFERKNILVVLSPVRGRRADFEINRTRARYELYMEEATRVLLSDLVHHFPELEKGVYSRVANTKSN